MQHRIRQIALFYDCSNTPGNLHTLSLFTLVGVEPRDLLRGVLIRSKQRVRRIGKVLFNLRRIGPFVICKFWVYVFPDKFTFPSDFEDPAKSRFGDQSVAAWKSLHAAYERRKECHRMGIFVLPDD